MDEGIPKTGHKVHITRIRLDCTAVGYYTLIRYIPSTMQRRKMKIFLAPCMQYSIFIIILRSCRIYLTEPFLNQVDIHSV